MKENIKDIMIIILLGLIMIVALLSGVERLIWANAKDYPKFLLSNEVHLASEDKALELMQLTCIKKDYEIIKHGNYMYARCGLLWPLSRVTKITLAPK